MTSDDGSKGTVDVSCRLEGPVSEPLEVSDDLRSFFAEGETVAWTSDSGYRYTSFR